MLPTVTDWLWSYVLITALLAVGVRFTVGSRAVQVRLFRRTLSVLSNIDWKGSDRGISSFQALAVSVAGRVGGGNIAGVAVAITLGGPGALFWMWLIALVGMATKYAESLLAVHYREVDELGEHVGGPMYFIRNGLGQKWAWLGWLFAFFGALAGFGIGNGVQSNAMAEALQNSLGVPPLITGIVVGAITFSVLIGGIERIGRVTQIIVPMMAFVYVLGAIIILLANLDKIPTAITLIFTNAFSGELSLIHI